MCRLSSLASTLETVKRAEFTGKELRENSVQLFSSRVNTFSLQEGHAVLFEQYYLMSRHLGAASSACSAVFLHELRNICMKHF